MIWRLVWSFFIPIYVILNSVGATILLSKPIGRFSAPLCVINNVISYCPTGNYETFQKRLLNAIYQRTSGLTSPGNAGTPASQSNRFRYGNNMNTRQKTPYILNRFQNSANSDPSRYLSPKYFEEGTSRRMGSKATKKMHDTTTSSDSRNELRTPITKSSNENAEKSSTLRSSSPQSSIDVAKIYNETLYAKFLKGVDQLERKFFMATFLKLTSISAEDRRENGISFAQSGLFLQLLLLALSTEVDNETKIQINNCTDFVASDMDKLNIIKEILSTLPPSSDDLKFDLRSRLVVGENVGLSENFVKNVAPALNLRLEKINDTETPEELADSLNHMVEEDSGGSMHNTFEEDEVGGARAVSLTTMYFRARWRSAPTLLNDTRPFRDAPALNRAARMMRINDIMQYAYLTELDAEVLEISYATPGLTLLLIVPRNATLRRLAELAMAGPLSDITQRLRTVRVAATLPLYTLRMNLIMPGKLEAMGVSRLVDNSTAGGELRITHGVQRLMFWAEAGRNAFKDDGIEWDIPPELEVMVDRPYIFYVRWRNITLLNGNFVL